MSFNRIDNNGTSSTHLSSGGFIDKLKEIAKNIISMITLFFKGGKEKNLSEKHKMNPSSAHCLNGCGKLPEGTMNKLRNQNSSGSVKDRLSFLATSPSSSNVSKNGGTVGIIEKYEQLLANGSVNGDDGMAFARIVQER